MSFFFISFVSTWKTSPPKFSTWKNPPPPGVGMAEKYTPAFHCKQMLWLQKQETVENIGVRGNFQRGGKPSKLPESHLKLPESTVFRRT